jgi:hypothetical protein
VSQSPSSLTAAPLSGQSKDLPFSHLFYQVVTSPPFFGKEFHLLRRGTVRCLMRLAGTGSKELQPSQLGLPTKRLGTYASAAA